MDSFLTSLLCTIVILPTLYAIPEIEVLHRYEPLKERFLSRVVRQSNKACCGTAPLKLDMIFDLFQECKEEIGDVGKQNEGPCLFECAGKKLEVLDEDGKMKAEEYVELCQKMAEGDEQLEEHIKEVCTTQAEKTKDFPENIQDKYKCKLDMLIAFQGTHIEILLNCPAELKNNDAECEKMRESMKKQIQQAQG